MLRIEYFDKDRFMRQVSASHGSVLLHLDNGKTCDLKEDATASSILRMMDAPRKGFDITVTDPADVTGFLRYMLEAGRMDRVAGCVGTTVNIEFDILGKYIARLQQLK